MKYLLPLRPSPSAPCRPADGTESARPVSPASPDHGLPGTCQLYRYRYGHCEKRLPFKFSYGTQYCF